MSTIFRSTHPARQFIHRLLPAATLMLAAHNVSAAIVAGDLVISEVMANPSAVSDTTGEWFEIYNSSSAAIDLNGLILMDSGSNQHAINGNAIIGSNGYFVLGRNSDSSINGGYTPDYVYDNFTLANTQDAIILEFGGALVVSLLYNDNTLFGRGGNSAELAGGAFQLTPNTFTFGDGDIGTPGSAGSVPLTPSPVPLPASAWLFGSALMGLIARRKRA